MESRGVVLLLPVGCRGTHHSTTVVHTTIILRAAPHYDEKKNHHNISSLTSHAPRRRSRQQWPARQCVDELLLWRGGGLQQRQQQRCPSNSQRMSHSPLATAAPQPKPSTLHQPSNSAASRDECSRAALLLAAGSRRALRLALAACDGQQGPVSAMSSGRMRRAQAQQQRRQSRHRKQSISPLNPDFSAALSCTALHCSALRRYARLRRRPRRPCPWTGPSAASCHPPPPPRIPANTQTSSQSLVILCDSHGVPCELVMWNECCTM